MLFVVVVRGIPIAALRTHKLIQRPVHVAPSDAFSEPFQLLLCLFGPFE